MGGLLKAFFPRANVPKAQRSLLCACYNQLTLPSEYRSPNIRTAFKRHFDLPTLNIPQLNRAVSAGGKEARCVRVRMKLERTDCAMMRLPIVDEQVRDEIISANVAIL